MEQMKFFESKEADAEASIFQGNSSMGIVETYYYILETNKQMLVSLEQEIQFINAYKFLLEIRFENLLKININIPDIFS